MISLRVYGTPASQGSKKGYITPSGHVALTEADKKLRPWRNAVIEAAHQAGVIGVRLQGPLCCAIVSYFERPVAHFRTGRYAGLLKDSAPDWMFTTPDADKVARACLDALTESAVWGDDKQVALLITAERYCPVGVAPGAEITVTELVARQTVLGEEMD